MISSADMSDLPDGSTVLLVDDHQSILRVTRRMLARLGFEVIEADRGHKALAEFGQTGEQIDVVILDLGLPDMDGADVLAEMKRRRPDVRVIVSSGSHPGASGAFLGPVAPDGYLDKPYTLSTLRTTLGRVG